MVSKLLFFFFFVWNSLCTFQLGNGSQTSRISCCSRDSRRSETRETRKNEFNSKWNEWNFFFCFNSSAEFVFVFSVLSTLTFEKKESFLLTFFARTVLLTSFFIRFGKTMKKYFEFNLHSVDSKWFWFCCFPFLLLSLLQVEDIVWKQFIFANYEMHLFGIYCYRVDVIFTNNDIQTEK